MQIPDTILGLAKSAIGGSARFQSNFLRLASASILGQIISLLALPIITRFYDPKAFAVLAIFIATQAIITSFSTARYEWILPNAKSQKAALNYFVIAMGVATLVSFVILASGFIWFLLISAQAPDWLSLYPWLALAVFLSSLKISLHAWMVHSGNLKPVASSILLQLALTNILSIALALILAPTGYLLVACYISGLLGGCLLLIWHQRKVFLESFATLSWSETKAILRQNASLSLTSIAVSMVNATAFNIQIFLISRFFGAAAAGQYSVAMRLSTAPITLITSSIANSFWAEAASMIKESARNLLKFYFSTLKRLAAAAVILIGINVFVSLVITPILGDNWAGTGLYILALLPYSVATLIFGPTNHLVVYDKQIFQLFSDGLGLIFSAVAIVTMAHYGYPDWAAILVASICLLLGYMIRAVLHIYANKTYSIDDHTSDMGTDSTGGGI